jgi:CubicO group peptidase (beta-lactamase class C family)
VARIVYIHADQAISTSRYKGFDAEGKPILEDNTTAITLRQLLTHTVGLGTDIADPELMRWSNYVGRKATCLDYTLEGINGRNAFPWRGDS